MGTLGPMRAPALAMVMASAGGLLLGTVLPDAGKLRAFALIALFVQTLVAVGSLAEASARPSYRWPVRMLVTHHVCVSLPLLAVGLLLGLDSPLGAGAFLLGAVPPAAGLPSYAAACGADVLPLVRFCLLAYTISLALTPALVLGGFGDTGALSMVVGTLLVGLVIPSTVGTLGRQRLSRIPRPVSFALVGTSVLVLTIGLGRDLREAVAAGLHGPAYLALALALGFGRCFGGGFLGALLASPGMRLETILGGGYKNAVLAAVIAHGVMGPLAALPALLSILAEAILLAVMSRHSQKLHPPPVSGRA